MKSCSKLRAEDQTPYRDVERIMVQQVFAELLPELLQTAMEICDLV
jgi:hypothetical protein